MEPFTNALEGGGATARRDVTPLEVAEHYLDAIAELDPRLNAICWCDADAVRAAARAATVAARDARPADLPPLFGVPIPIKDNVAVAGWPTTHGSLATTTAPAPGDDPVVAALRRAGALPLARTTMPEFAMLTATESERYGLTRNPWDLTRGCGGSSGGAAVAVAAGLAPIAHGTDGGGSIRIPAACCGLVGLKPSRGRVPSTVLRWEGASVQGALTRTVADTAAVLDAIGGSDPLAWSAAPPPARAFAEEVGAAPGRLRFGLVEQPPLGGTSCAASVAAVRAAARCLEGLGHEVEPLAVELLTDELFETLLAMASASLGLLDADVPDWSRAGPIPAERRRVSRRLPSTAYASVVAGAQRWTREVVRSWNGSCDALLTPTLAIPPPRCGAVLDEVRRSDGRLPATVVEMVAFTAMANITGLPAISLPLAEDAGLPVGVQLIGGPWGEAELLRVSAQLEEALPWSQRRPDLNEQSPDPFHEPKGASHEHQARPR